MKRVAVPKQAIKESVQVYGDCVGLTVYLQLDPSQKWTITKQGGGYVFLAKKGQIIRLTYTAFDRLFDEVYESERGEGR